MEEDFGVNTAEANFKESILIDNTSDSEDEEEEEGEAPLPWFYLLVIYGVLASDAMTFLIIQPLGPDQCVERFGMVDNPGLCSGILVGIFIFGTALSAVPLGHVADLVGRKGVMMLGLLTGGLSAIFYGLTSSFWVAALLRFFGGVTNANVVMCSAACADLTKGKQRVLAFAYLWGVFSISSALSGSFAGIFIDPKRQPFTYDDNRFFFPLFVVGCCNMFTLVLVFFFLPETNQFAAKGKEDKRDEGLQFEEEYAPDCNSTTPTKKTGIIEKIQMVFEVFADDKLQQLICCCYCLNSFGNSAVLTVVVLFFREDIDDRGLGMEDFGYGIMLGIFSVTGIIFQIGCFKRVATTLGTNHTIYTVALILYILGCFLTPLSVFPFTFGVTDVTKLASETLALLALAPISIASMMALSILSTMQSNITHPTRQGFSLGVLQSLSCFSRAIGPVALGALFDALGAAFQLGSAAFIICGFVYLACLLLIQRMTEEDKWRSEESRFEAVDVEFE